MKIILIIVLCIFPAISHGYYFASIKNDNANLRVGPGNNYPIEWVYIQKNMPVQVLEKYGRWRKIKDIDNTVGWMHQNLLSNKLYFIVTQTTSIYTSNDKASAVKATIDPMVIVSPLKICDGSDELCRVQVEKIKGWIKRECLWGIE